MTKSKLFATSLLALFALIGASCSKTVDLSEERRSTNEAAWRAFADSTGFQRVTLPGIDGTAAVYMRVTKASGSGVTVDYTDEVQLFRDGYQTTDWQQSGVQARRIIQTLGTNTVTAERVRDLKLGLQIAVQNLQEGDQAEVVIPWYLNNNVSPRERTEDYVSLYYQLSLAKVTKPAAN